MNTQVLLYYIEMNEIQWKNALKNIKLCVMHVTMGSRNIMQT